MPSLAKIDERLSTKRRALAVKIETKEAAFEALDTAASAIDALEAIESPTAEQTKELADKIAAYKVSRKAAVKLSDEVNAAESEVRDIESERAMRDQASRQVATLAASAGRVAPPENPALAAAADVRVTALTPDQLDHDISSFFRCSYLSKIHGMSVAAIAAGQAGPQYRNDRLQAAVLKSANPAIFPDNYVARLIEILRPKTVMRNLPGVLKLPLINGNMRMPRQSSGSTATYIGEMVNIPVSNVGTNQITWSAKKLTVMVVESGELMRQASPQSDAIIRNDIVEQMRVKEDSTFLRSTASATVPGGLKYFADVQATQVFAASAPGAATVQSCTSDIGKLIVTLEQADLDMSDCVFIMAPRTRRFLMDLRDGNGNAAFPEVARGELRGYPYRVSNQIPTNLTVNAITNASELYLVKASDFVIADAPTYELNVSTEAAYHDGSTVQAAYSQDAAVFRLIVEHDTNMRQPKAVTYLKDITWGL